MNRVHLTENFQHFLDPEWALLATFNLASNPYGVLGTLAPLAPLTSFPHAVWSLPAPSTLRHSALPTFLRTSGSPPLLCLRTPADLGECGRSRMGEVESIKQRSNRESKKEVSGRGDREKEKHREKKEKEKARDRDFERDRESRRSERERSDDERYRERRERDSRQRDRERPKERDSEKEKHGDREDRDRDRDKDMEMVKEKTRERDEKEFRDKVRVRRREEKEREREREEREREKEKERARERAREKRRELERDGGEDGGRDHDRKRRRREEDSRERERERSSRHREGSPDVHRKANEEEAEAKEKRAWVQDLEEEQRKLDEEMDKRRRRVQEWQELKRKKEKQEREKDGMENGEELSLTGKNWTLDGESDDEEADQVNSENDADGIAITIDVGFRQDVSNTDVMNVNSDNRGPMITGVDSGNGEDEIDPLDAFMNSMVLPEVEKLQSVENALVKSDDEKMDSKKVNKEGLSNGVLAKNAQKNPLGRILPGEDSDPEDEDMGNEEVPPEDEDDEDFMKRVKKTKVEKLSIVDHSKIQYPLFRKNFYIEVREITRMMTEDVVAYRKQMELKVHGKDIPKPIKTWNQTGLGSKILDTIKKLNFEKPMPIQAQALPVIMSGRDCIGIAKTGSGKTLAFVLPMLRHVKDQPPVVPGDGPIALIMAPTRELVQQIHSDIKKFSKGLGFNCVPVYGGSGVAQQISELKRGTEIVVCTPGRMIDILCTSAGKITNLRKVTYFVMDEADRMFDMGFEPQITRIVQNTRPDRQTVLFSATFPRQVEILARKVLNKPVEIQVGGRSVVNKDIAQLVEVRQESDRFLRLLELLGEWYEKGKILVFVHSQEKCDSLFKDLLKHGYPCLSLHGAKDQTDRESTLSDFKSNVCNLLIATSVASRGLDVKELELVVNFDVPNHYEDYVHRVGRTGRAGRKGMAVTFISEEDSKYAPDLVKALELSEQAVPEDLKALADSFMARVKEGMEQAHGTGYGGSGFKFNEEEDESRKAVKKAQAREYGFEEDKSESDSDDDGVRKAGGDLSQAAILAQAAALAQAAKASVSTIPAPAGAVQLLSTGSLPISTNPVLAAGMLPSSSLSADAAARAAALAAAMNLQHNLAKIQADAMPEHYEAELEINEFPQNARWKVTHKETLGPISEWTGAAITTRGQYYPPGKFPGPTERKLYLFIEGPTESSVKKAKAELKRVLEDYTAQSISLPGSAQPGKYSVL
ncbi:DEAD-box ATP-dependent RNA helicase 42 [Platanthera guangdongensis]|uniref:RNA helicase n=1 Tax=Platanthera guangdongensis TaxID=2320717 RepID=A0ABR2LFW9_9ASPA